MHISKYKVKFHRKVKESTLPLLLTILNVYVPTAAGLPDENKLIRCTELKQFKLKC